MLSLLRVLSSQPCRVAKRSLHVCVCLLHLHSNDFLRLCPCSPEQEELKKGLAASGLPAPRLALDCVAGEAGLAIAKALE